MRLDEACSPALVVSDDHAPVILSPVGARRLTDEIRGHLGNAILKLQVAREGQADRALGYPTWWQYVESEFGDLRELRLPREERRALVESMRASELSVRAIARKLDVSVGTVHADLPSTREKAAEVVALREPEVSPYEGMSQPREALARVAAQDDRGLTCRELEAETGWLHQSASPALRKCERRGWVERDGRIRQGFGVYVVTDVGRAAMEQ